MSILNNNSKRNATIRLKGSMGSYFNYQNEPKSDWSSEAKKVVAQFFRRTTMAGITQIFTRQKSSWRMFWTAVSLAGLFMSLYQSYDVMSDYFRGRTIQVIDYRTVSKIQFPSITFCTNIRLHRDKVDTFIYESICKGNSKKECLRVAEDLKNKDRLNEDDFVADLLTYQANFSRFDRNTLFYNTFLYPFVNSCKVDSLNCPMNDEDFVFHFSNLLHGQCFTINRAIENGIQARESGDIDIILNMDRESRKLKFNEIFATFWVHAPGTSPSLHSDNGGHIYPGDKVKITFTLQNITRMVTKSCFVATELQYRMLDPQYSARTPYLYSQKSCVALKMDQVKVSRNCYDAAMHYQNLSTHLKLENGHFCSELLREVECSDECDDFDDDITDRIRSQCKTPCQEVLVHYSTNTMSLWLENLVERSMLGDTDVGITNVDSTAMNESVSVVEILPQTHLVETVFEEYKYKEVDFLGILGGNISLWVGISVISLTELLELVVLLIGALKKSNRKIEKPKKRFIIERNVFK